MREGEVLSTILGLEPTDNVVLAVANWTQVRAMMMKNKNDIRFRQHREGPDDDWVITDFVSPETDDWYWVVRQAHELKLHTPAVAWSGPVEEIPDDILRSDAPIMVRALNSPGWFNLRLMAASCCEGEA